jgi:uncharacterized OB-fold protein
MWGGQSCLQPPFRRPENELRTGTVYTETIVHLAPERFTADVPYQVIIVKLDGGDSITARVDGERVSIDDRVIESETRNGISFFRKSL